MCDLTAMRLKEGKPVGNTRSEVKIETAHSGERQRSSVEKFPRHRLPKGQTAFPKAGPRSLPLVAETAGFAISPVHSANGRDTPQTGLAAVAATPHQLTADQSMP